MQENERINSPILIETQDAEIIDIDVAEVTPSTDNIDALNHATLYNREMSDAHPIGAITGLQEQLDDIKSTSEQRIQENTDNIGTAIGSLEEQAGHINKIEAYINLLTQRLQTDENNIISAVNTANKAYNKAQESATSVGVSEEAVKEALESILKSEGKIEEFEDVLAESVTAATQAKELAQSAATAAEALKTEAIDRANEAWAKADEVQNQTSSLCAKIDQYSVGEYSQAYGLTREQANSILEPGLIYVPIEPADAEYHKEEYYGPDGSTYVRWFTSGFLYKWDLLYNNNYGWRTVGNTIDGLDVVVNTEDYSDPENIVSPDATPCVFFSAEEPLVDESWEYGYWYTNGATVTAKDGSTDKFNPYTLYKWENSQWIAVATLLGNTSNRMVSEVYQTSNQITMGVANPRGCIAALDAKVTDTASTVESLAEWQNGGEVSKAIIRQHTEDGVSSIVISTIQQDGEETTEQASMVFSASKNNGSALAISAENIDFEAGNFKISAENIDLNGAVTANGNVTIGEDGKLTAVGGNFRDCIIDETCTIHGKLTATSIEGDDLSALGATIGGWHIGDGYILSLPYTTNGGDFIEGATITGLLSSATKRVTVPIKYNNEDRNALLQYQYSSLVVPDETSAVRFIAGCTPKLKPDDDGRLYLNITDNVKFMVLDDGSLYASAADINGHISANDGQIGDLNISDGGLIYGDFDPENNISKGIKIDKYGLWADKSYASSGSIGNWEYDANNLSIEDEDVHEVTLRQTGISLQLLSPTGPVIGVLPSTVSWETLCNLEEASDARVKKNIETLSNKYEKFFDNLAPTRYQYINGSSGRYHTGFIAQEVVEALVEAELDTQQFAGVMLFREGRDDECWHLRKNEFVALNTWQIQKAKARIAALEETVAKLEDRLSKLENK